MGLIGLIFTAAFPSLMANGRFLNDRQGIRISSQKSPKRHPLIIYFSKIFPLRFNWHGSLIDVRPDHVIL